MASKNVFGSALALALAAIAVAAATAGTNAWFKLTSPAFAPGTAIPDVYSCKGEGKSPALAWTSAPKGTKSFAIWVNDPDAPGGGYTHWLGWGIKPTAHGLASGQRLPLAAPSGNGSRAYQGMCAPEGAPHHYTFTVYALDVKVVKLAPASAAAASFRRAIKGHVLGQAKLVGLWEPSINAASQTTTTG